MAQLRPDTRTCCTDRPGGHAGTFGATEHRARRFARLTIPMLFALAVSACSPSGERDPSAGMLLEMPVPAGAGSGQAHLATGPGGEIVLSWLEPSDAGHALKFATLTHDSSDDGWSAARTIAQGGNFFVNWADFPSVVPITSDVWAAHWLALAPDNFHAYDIMMTVSPDAGASWGEPFMLHDDGTETEHGFVSLFPWQDGIGAVWLDGRHQADIDWDEYGLADDDDREPIGVSLRYARLGYDGRFLEQGEIDALVCDCCPTDVALAGGTPVLAYRDRTPDEIRDIAVRRIDDGAWSEPVQLGPDNWSIAGCPVNGPAVAADGDDVVVAWFTGVDNQPRVRAAYSSDGGRSFGAAVDIDTSGAFGYVGVELLDDGDAVVSWWRRGAVGQGTALSARRVAPDGTLGVVRRIAESPLGRPIDMPQLARRGEQLVFAWTESSGDGAVRSVIANVPR